MGRDLTCLWRSSSALGVGELTRFRIKFNLAKFLSHPTTTVKPFPLTVEVKNSTPLIYRGALLTGPYNISACVIPTRDLLTRNIYACLQLKPVLACGEIWRATLDLPKEGVGDWTADIFSEVLFSPNKVEYEISVLAELPEGDYNLRSDNDATSDYENTVSYTPAIEYVVWKTEDIFGLPDLSSRKIGDDVHLVVLTHGLNGSALDKKYLKERLDEKYNQQTGTRVVPYVADVNHASTWDGVEVCARRIADKLLQIAGWPWNENIQDRTDKEEISTKPYISKISLIGHSLGGLINVCLAGYLNSLTNGEFYRSIQAVNFITVATPWLGSTEQPWYIKAGMQAGAVGQTGKDLLAVQRTRSEQVQARGAAEENTLEEEPLLLALAHPSSPSHQALAKFQHRTVYANIVNDVSVSFRTASLYF
ncbi:141_t:CDS:1, partial [Paraglomus occultum]